MEARNPFEACGGSGWLRGLCSLSLLLVIGCGEDNTEAPGGGGDAAPSDIGGTDGAADSASDGVGGDGEDLSDDDPTAETGEDASDDGVTDDAGEDVPVPGGSGDVAGVAFTPNGTGLDVLPGAILSIADGPSATTDALGRFVLEDVDAGVPVIVRVEGPPVTDPDDLDVFSTAELTVTAVRDDRVDLFPILLRGCVGYIDAAAGGVATLKACGGAGSGAVTLGANALETAGGDPFTGVVRLEVVIIDPAAPLDRSTVPTEPPPLVDLVLGAIEVRLMDSATLAPLNLAESQSATVRLSLDEVPEGSSDEDIELSTYDETLHAWVDAPNGVVVTNADGRFYEFGTTHFTRLVVGLNPPERRQRCVTAVPGLCRTSSCNCNTDACDRVPVNVLVSDRWRTTMQVLGDRLESCIMVAQDSNAQFFFSITTATGDLASASWSTNNTGSGLTHVDCCAGGAPVPGDEVCDCLDLGLLSLQSPQLGCIEGLLQTPSGPLSGPIDVMVGGQRVGQVTAASDGTFCQELPVLFPDLETELVFEDGRGNQLSITPDRSSTGQTCAGGSCQQIGAQTTSCNLSGSCSEAAFTTDRVDDFADCSSKGAFQSACEDCLGIVDRSYLIVDGTSSQGQIQKYTWGVTQLAPVQAPLIPGGSAEGPTAGFCLGAGRYRVRLVTWSDLRVGRRDSADELVSVGLPWPGPCSGSVTQDNTGYNFSGMVTYTYDGFDLASIADDRTVGGLSSDFVEHFFTTETSVDGVVVPAGTLQRVERFDGNAVQTYYYYAVDHPDIAALPHPEIYVREVVHSNSEGTAVRTDRYSYAPATAEVGASAIACTRWICNTGDISQCEGAPPETIPTEQQVTLEFNEHGQLIEVDNSGLVTTYDYEANTPTDFHALVCARPFTHPRPIAYPLQTRSFGTYAEDFSYDGSHNLTQTEVGESGKTAVWTYTYECWEP